MTNKDTPTNQDIVRDEKGRFVPGHSGNVAGMPAGTFSFKGLLRRKLMEHPERADSIIEELIKLGLDADLPSIKEMKEWIDGKESDKVELRGTMLVATPDQLDYAFNQIAEAQERMKLLEQGDATNRTG